MIKKEKILEILSNRDGYKSYYSKILTIVINKNNQAITRCPFHTDTNPSLSINLKTGQFNCFGCGFSGDIFTFRMKYENISFDECLKRFADEYNIKEEKLEIDITKDDIERWKNNLYTDKAKEIKSFLNNVRGITDKSLLKYNIGYDFKKESITIPFYNNGNVTCVKFFNYDIKNNKKNVTTIGKASLLIHPLLDIIETEDIEIYICEGEFDCILLAQFGLVAITGSAGAKTWKNDWSEYLKGARIIICYDSDDCGREASKKLAKEIYGIVKNVKIIDLFPHSNSKEMKDVTDYFIKCKNSIYDFNKLVDKTNIITDIKSLDTEKNNSNDFKSLLEKEEKKIVINTSQDFVKNKMYYAININKNKFLITSDKQIISFSKCTDHSIELSTTTPDIFCFSAKGILKFINDEFNETPEDIYNFIYNYISKYIFLKDNATYSLISLWVMGTYIYRVFRYYPYIHLNAEKGSGKTMLMEVIAPICFNGQLSVNSTEAVIYRDVQNNSPTLFIDELEKMGKEDKEKYYGIMSVLKTGFCCNGIVKRCDGKYKDRIRTFSTYSPKMFAGIKDIDDVLADRTIKIKMYRKLSNEHFERYTVNDEILNHQSYLRDLLYCFGLKYAYRIRGIYEEIPFNYNYDSFTNRELDIWLPIFTLAYFVENYTTGSHTSNLLNDISFYAEKSVHNKRNYDDNNTVKLLTILNEFIEKENPDVNINNLYYYNTDRLFDFFKLQDDFKWIDSKSFLTRQLKTLEIYTEVKNINNHSYRAYKIDIELLKEYSKRYL
jgi:hypothetical protein